MNQESIGRGAATFGERLEREQWDMRQLREKVAKHYGRRMVQFTLSLPMPGDE
jgi:hypothetical protein